MKVWTNVHFRPIHRSTQAIVGVVLALGVAPGAQAAVVVAYESTRAYTTESGQVLEGEPTDDPSNPGWVVPVVFPKQIFTQPAPTRVVLTWAVTSKAPTGVPDVIVDGSKVGPAIRLGRSGFMATLDLPRFMLTDAQHDVQLRLAIGPMVYRSRGDTVVVHPVSPFILLERTFRHDRCSNCHSLQSGSAIREFHGGFGVDLPDSPDVVPGKSVVCMGCHEESFTGVQAWMAPTTDRAPNFRLFPGTKALCDVIVELASQRHTADPPFDVLSSHFRVDQRIVWALENGEVPLDMPPLPTAPPHSSDHVGDLGDWWVMWGRFGKFCAGLE